MYYLRMYHLQKQRRSENKHNDCVHYILMINICEEPFLYQRPFFGIL